MTEATDDVSTNVVILTLITKYNELDDELKKIQVELVKLNLRKKKLHDDLLETQYEFAAFGYQMEGGKLTTITENEKYWIFRAKVEFEEKGKV